MNRIARILVVIASMVAMGAYALPLWKIRLLAPQYPEGLGMDIAVSSVKGAKEFDLQNINKLNHYVGMKAIEPDAIPELRLMPYLLGALIVAGLVTAVIGKRRVLYGWLVAFGLLGIAGLADFWRWGYDYGHDLDPEAVLSYAGMTYQPPLIGTKQLLNIYASSWPAAGGWMLGISFGLGLAAALAGWRRHREDPGPRNQVHSAGTPGYAALVVVSLMAMASVSFAQRTIVVSPAGQVSTIAAAVRAADSGATIVVKPGVYREPMILVDKPLTIVGEGFPTLDGEGARQIMAVSANGVTVRGLHFRNVGVSHTEDRAAIKLSAVRNCVIENNRIDDALFGIYLAGVTDCAITGNVIRAHGVNEATTGNGIHLWSSRGIRITDNSIVGHRDGIYFEFVHDSRMTRNLSEGNLRYGLHFMYSDSCIYESNTFRRNGSGVAVMYTKSVQMVGNHFEDNWGSAAYGLLLKEIYDSRIEGNHFTHNTVGIVADGAVRMVARGNQFVGNGWAIRLDASSDSASVLANNFVGNTFDLASNSRENPALVRGNFFDEYRGYDLDRDGVGDVPHRPVRLFSLLVARNEPTLILLHSLFVAVLDATERAFPALTPSVLADDRPAMRRIS